MTPIESKNNVTMNTHRITEAHLDKICTQRRTKVTEQVPVEVFFPSPAPFKITDGLGTHLSAERGYRREVTHWS